MQKSNTAQTFSNIARDFVPSKLYLSLMMPTTNFLSFFIRGGGGEAQADSSFRSRERVHRSNFRAFPYSNLVLAVFHYINMQHGETLQMLSVEQVF